MELDKNYKKLISIFILIVSFLVFYLILRINFNLYLKITILTLIFSILLCFLTIFEITSSIIENLVFWLLASLILSYFFLPAGLILFFLATFRIFSNANLLKIFLKIPYIEFSKKNFLFLIWAIFLISGFYFYQKLVVQENFPLDFNTFHLFLSNFLKFFKLKIDFNKKISIILTKSLEKTNIPKELLTLIKLPDKTLEEFIFDSFKDLWANLKNRKIIILGSMIFIFSIIYPILKTLASLFSYFSLFFYFLLLKIKFIKINYQSINKEVLEL